MHSRLTITFAPIQSHNNWFKSILTHMQKNCFNPLKHDDYKQTLKNSVSTSPNTQRISISKSNLLILLKEIIFIPRNMNHINAF